jgi:hypothetical protein
LTELLHAAADTNLSVEDNSDERWESKALNCHRLVCLTGLLYAAAYAKLSIRDNNDERWETNAPNGHDGRSRRESSKQQRIRMSSRWKYQSNTINDYGDTSVISCFAADGNDYRLPAVETLSFLTLVSTSKRIAYKTTNSKSKVQKKIAQTCHKAAAQYESSGKIGFSDVSQAGVIEALFSLHAKAPFKPIEAEVFDPSAHPTSNRTVIVGGKNQLTSATCPFCVCPLPGCASRSACSSRTHLLHIQRPSIHLVSLWRLSWTGLSCSKPSYSTKSCSPAVTSLETRIITVR